MVWCYGSIPRKVQKSLIGVMFNYVTRRRWYWAVAHAWSILQLRRRVVLAIIFFCVAASVIVNHGASPLFHARATLRVNLPTCSRCGHPQPQCDSPEVAGAEYCICR